MKDNHSSSRRRLWRDLGLFAAGLLLGCCVTAGVAATLGSEPAVASATTGSAPTSLPAVAEALGGTPPDQVGGTFRNIGATVTVRTVRETSSVQLNESSYRPGSGFETYTRTPAGSNAKFVVVETRVVNDSRTSFDLTCSLPVATKLIDARGRAFDAIEDLYKIRGNPECNDSLQPGFDSPMTWIYRVPADAEVSAWSFEDSSDMSTIGSNAPTVVGVRAAR